MPEFKLVIGNKEYSSWSLRPWLVLKHIGVPFQEQMVGLGEENSKAEIKKVSPSGFVPVLYHGALVIWDSLAICEYLNELYPQARLWPSASDARAVARAVSAEMHSGFAELRHNLVFSPSSVYEESEVRPEVAEQIHRVLEIWETCRTRFGAQGPFLFGGFSIADAMFAPVVSRFRTYSIPLPAFAAEYRDAIWSLPAMREWVKGAEKEMGQGIST